MSDTEGEGASLPSMGGGKDAREVANFFLDLAARRKQPVTQITLQKVLYFAHAWFLARQGAPLVDEHFEAWTYGPVLRSIHEQFRRWEKEPIRSRATRINFDSGKPERVSYSFPPQSAAALERIFDFYSRYEPFALVEMTHEPGGPWDQVFRQGSVSARVGMAIPNDAIRVHFTEYYNEKLFN